MGDALRQRTYTVDFMTKRTSSTTALPPILCGGRLCSHYIERTVFSGTGRDHAALIYLQIRRHKKVKQYNL